MAFRLLIALICSAFLFGANEAFALDPDRAIAELQHTAWTTANGAPAGVWCLTQSSDGYLWLGTGLGLYVFDGVHFEKFRSVDGSELQGIDVTAVSASPSGAIWVGFQSGGISAIRNGKITNYRPGGGLPIGSMISLTVDDAGVVWASGNDGLTRFDGKSWQTIGKTWSLPPGSASFLAIAGDRTLWVKLRGNGGIFYLKANTHQFVRTSILGTTLGGFAKDRQSRVWAVDNDDLLHALPMFGPNGKPGPNGPVRETSRLMIFDADGTIWGSTRFATSGWPAMAAVKGIYRRRSPKDGEHLNLATGEFDSYEMRDGLSSDVAAAILEDREGNIWVGTNLGLDRFSPANIVSDRTIRFTSAAGYLPALGRDGLYFTGGGALYRAQAGENLKMIVPSFSSGPNVFLADKDGSLLFNDPPNNGEDISRWWGKIVATYTLPADRFAGSVGGLTDDGTLWISGSHIGVLRLEQNHWVHFPVLEKSGATIDIIQSDKHGGMWLGDYKDHAAFHVDSKTGSDVRRYAIHAGGIQVIYPYSGGILFGGDSGLTRFDGRNFRTIPSRDVEPLALVSGIVESPDKHVYINSGVGIVRVETSELDRAFDDPAHRLSYQLLDSHDGLSGVAEQDCFCNTATRGPDSRLWFITGNGIAWIDPAHFHRNMLAPPVYVRSISNGRTQYAARPDLSLPAGSANLRIDYTALSFTDPDRMQFRYKLDGVESDWVDAGSRRQAFYTRLGPGDYRFHVIASNNDGVWNRVGANQTFTIRPTFLQSRFFLVLCIFAVSIFLWLLYAVRLRQVTAGIHSRMQERLSERERIARELHDTLLQGIDGLILKFQSIANRFPPDEPLRTSMDQALERADDVLSESRDSMRNLRPSQSELDISDAFAATGEAKAWGSTGKFRVVSEGTVRKLHPIVRDEVAKIGNEAIANAIKHSRAGNIEVSVVYLRNRIVVTVTDDGAGISEDVLKHGRQGHFGLTGMRERAERIRASLSVSSGSGAGTTVTLIVPAAIAYADARGIKLRSWLHHALMPGRDL